MLNFAKFYVNRDAIAIAILETYDIIKPYYWLDIELFFLCRILYDKVYGCFCSFVESITREKHFRIIINIKRKNL